MIPIYRMPVIQIEVTNVCNLSCSNCTRFVGHHKKPFFMDLETVAKAIDSLEGYPHEIGIMGGEPTMHPQFKEICLLVQKMIPNRRQRALWTNGLRWKEYEEIIKETFDADKIIYNDHRDENVGEHQSLLLAATDIVDDKELMWRLIGNCWVQWRWAASITPKGGFFCEVAAAQDYLFDGPGGYPLEKDWWNKNPNEFMDQVKRYCPNCSAAIPMSGVDAHASHEMVSKSIAERLKQSESPKFLNGNYKLVDIKLTEADIEKTVKDGWTPWSHRPYKQNAPDKKEQITQKNL
ncbi:MAG: Radical SAM superfamily enzyme [Candidatus Magasanikbacteria bacterium GW2011_GWA2_41_55]|uniref:Radical SAM superfamily enzyme n=1 Tax=Candidatus Magasanikbacteria bacterium GW2011_GWA2_41_55 TaxID=1619038 RepID=A0A0G0YVF8_9BACT|nr:MAG: Radical SAM superfamily enzyme [Candidatus Magasanikbacteria bacterium GW2011_GWA2_41_55]